MSLLSGPPAYVPRTPWNAWAAVGAAFLMFFGALVAAYGAAVLVKAVAGAGAESAAGAPSGQRDMLLVMVWLFAAQIILSVLTLIAAGQLGGHWRDVLALHPPRGGGRVLVEALVLMLLLVGVYNGLLYLVARDAMMADLKVFIEMARSSNRWLALASIGLGAPVSEELLFRGFLLSALAASPLGFRHGAVLATAAWTALHAGYSAYGLVEVFLVGLYLSWLLWRTGSLWVPLFCHAVYNTGLLLVLMLV